MRTLLSLVLFVHSLYEGGVSVVGAALPSTTGTCVLRRRNRRTYVVVASKDSIALHDWRIPAKISDFHFLTFDADFQLSNFDYVDF